MLTFIMSIPSNLGVNIVPFGRRKTPVITPAGAIEIFAVTAAEPETFIFSFVRGPFVFGFRPNHGALIIKLYVASARPAMR